VGSIPTTVNEEADVIAALFVEKGGVYYGLPGVDPWDRERDARLYAGPWPVVAHPPCERWSAWNWQRSALGRDGLGADGGCFLRALQDVRAYGGVLEHPRRSRAFEAHGLATPARGQWIASRGGWVTEVDQGRYGRRAIKGTWLFYSGHAPPPPLDWTAADYAPELRREAGPHRRAQGWDLLCRAERKRTPLPFRDLLLSLAALSAKVPT
jgi:hypothetical protein